LELSGARRLDVQGLRAVAVLLVVAFHAGVPGVPGASTGVDVFFVISGYVITAMLGRELARTGRLGLRRFYQRRIRRLWPALAVMLVMVVLAGLPLDPAGVGPSADLTGVAASLFAANFYLYSLLTGYFGADAQLNPLLHTWTLAIEAQFYLFFPLLLLVAWRFGGRRAAAVAVAGATAGSFLLALAWSGSTLGFYASPARAWEFGLGALVALAAPTLGRMHEALATLLAISGAGLLAAAVIGDPAAHLAVSAIPPAALGAAALVAAGCVANPARRLLSLRPLTLLGDLSYSWYLWHWPLIVFARALFPTVGAAAAAGALVSLGPAWASYRYVENPIRLDPRVRGRTLERIALACLVVPFAAAAVALAVQPRLPTHPRDLTAADEVHADRARGCDSSAPFGDPSRTRCVWRVAHARGMVVLIGDSNAGQFTEPVTAAAAHAGYDVAVATFHNCPFAQVAVHDALLDDDACARFSRESLEVLQQERPSLVVIAARTNRYIGTGPERSLAAMGSDSWTTAPRVRGSLFEHGLRSELAALTSARIPVLLVHPVPELDQERANCAVLLLLLGKCRGSLSRAEAEARLRTARAVEDLAARSLRGVTLVDFSAQICSATCPRELPGGAAMYLDTDHLSVAGAETLTGAFYRAIVADARPAAD
jgi:peptidoglycan/LPS O-acetylase OafA/YrhL